MIRLYEVDLADPADRPPEAHAGCRVLVRDRGVPLGDVELRTTVGADAWAWLEQVTTPAARLRRRLAGVPAPGDASTISVVICTRDRPAHLDACLRAVAALDPAPGEVLVVDNASTGGRTREVARRHGVRVVDAPVPGLDRARNVGWHAAGRDVIAYLDDDTRPSPSWAGAVARAVQQLGADVVTGPVLPAEVETAAQQRFEARRGMHKGFLPQVRHRDASPVGYEPFLLGVGANMAFRTEVLEAVGGFDERLDVGTSTRGGGDLDTMWWAVEHGFTAVYEPAAIVRHVHRRAALALVRQMRDNGTGYAAWFAKVAAVDPARRGEVRRARRVWWAKRHLRGLARAVRYRGWVEAVLVLAEAEGALHGGARYRAEADAHPAPPWPLPAPRPARPSGPAR